MVSWNACVSSRCPIASVDSVDIWKPTSMWICSIYFWNIVGSSARYLWYIVCFFLWALCQISFLENGGQKKAHKPLEATRGYSKHMWGSKPANVLISAYSANSTSRPYTLFRHSFWHTIWKYSWHPYIYILKFYLAFFLAYTLTFYLTLSWGPAVPTEIWSSRLAGRRVEEGGRKEEEGRNQLC